MIWLRSSLDVGFRTDTLGECICLMSGDLVTVRMQIDIPSVAIREN